jgi:hypothetical protein
MARHGGVAGRRIRSTKEWDESRSRPQGDRDYRRAAAVDEERNNIKRCCALHNINHSRASGVEPICNAACAGFDQPARIFTWDS